MRYALYFPHLLISCSDHLLPAPSNMCCIAACLYTAEAYFYGSSAQGLLSQVLMSLMRDQSWAAAPPRRTLVYPCPYIQFLLDSGSGLEVMFPHLPSAYSPKSFRLLTGVSLSNVKNHVV